MEAYIIGPISI